MRSSRESSGFYRAFAELLRSANPKEYFLDNHNAILPCHFSYITNTPSCSLHSARTERTFAPSSGRWSGSELRARHLQRFPEISKDFTRYELEFQPFALELRPGPSHLVQSQFPRRVEFILASFFPRVCSRQRETIRDEWYVSMIRFNGAIVAFTKFTLG